MSRSEGRPPERASDVRIFLAATSLRPAYGGPAVSVGQLAAALARAGVDVGLWAADGSAPDAACGTAKTSLQRFGGELASAVEAWKPDLIHDNGIWLPHNHALAAVARSRGVPRVVSTRGMLEPWAVRHKRWKKAVAWRLYQRRDLAGAQLHHATAEPEAANLRNLGLGVPVCTIGNGVDAEPLEPPEAGSGGSRTALFLGRIYPVKGLPMLVEAWARVRPEGWRLRIAGPDEAGHRAEIEQAVARAGLGDVVSFDGAIEGAAKSRALADADLLILPSHSESFGMVVAEALAGGRPVLTTTAVPWPLLGERRCGWRVAPTVDGLVGGLREATGRSRSELDAMGARGRAMIEADFGWNGVAARFLVAYRELMTPQGTAKPIRLGSPIHPPQQVS